MMSTNTYKFHGDQHLTPSELFFHIGVYQTCEQLGINDIVGVAAVISGQPLVPVRGKLGGATRGTSPASMLTRKMTRIQLKRRYPTLIFPILEPSKWKISMTRNLSAIAGRSIPVFGWAILSYDVVTIVRKTVSEYNEIVLPEDRIL